MQNMQSMGFLQLMTCALISAILVIFLLKVCRKGMSFIYAATRVVLFGICDRAYFDGMLGADFFNCCLIEIKHGH